MDGVKQEVVEQGRQPLRPLIDDSTCDDDIARLMKQCWAEDSVDRPDFSTLKKTIRKLNKYVDNAGGWYNVAPVKKKLWIIYRLKYQIKLLFIYNLI